MKIHSLHPLHTGVQLDASRVAKLVVLCGAALIGLASSTKAMAQTSTSSPGGNAVKNGLFTHGDKQFRVVDTASYRSEVDAGRNESGAIQQVSLLGHASGNCSSCGTSSCGGSCGTISMATSSCNSCGTSCGGRCGGRTSALSCNGAFAGICEPCSPYRYASVEAVAIQNDNDDFSFSPNFGTDDFDFEWAPRVTIGSVSDCVHGYEASFVGPLEWDASGSRAAAGTSTFFNPTTVTSIGTEFGTDLSFLSNGQDASQRMEAEYYSLEASKTLVGWEIAKLLIGGRYINYDEDYRYDATSVTTGSRGTALIGTDNQLYGLQIGADLLYPISKHGYSDTRLRAGGYVNDASADSSLTTSTGLSVRNSDSSTEFAGLFELGTGVRYQLGDMLSIRGGVELWYLTGIATVSEQATFTANQLRQRQGVRTDDDVLLTGFSVGAEIRY